MELCTSTSLRDRFQCDNWLLISINMVKELCTSTSLRDRFKCENCKSFGNFNSLKIYLAVGRHVQLELYDVINLKKEDRKVADLGQRLY